MESLLLSLVKINRQLSRTTIEEVEEIVLQDADQVEDFILSNSNLAMRAKHHAPTIRLRLAQRLFGPPRISLSWKQRCRLFGLLGKLDTLQSLTLQGTVMGQVISAELLSKALPSKLQVLQVDAGLILDEVSSIEQLARALQEHSSLRQIQLLNFLNHVRPGLQDPTTTTERLLLDPLVDALATCPQLQVLELSCLASFMEWKVPLISKDALRRLLTSTTKLSRLALTNLGLDDAEFQVIATQRPPGLGEILLNGNENTLVGLSRLIFGCCQIGSQVTHLEAINHVKLSDELYEYILWYLQRSHPCPLKDFQVTLPLRMDPTLLRLLLRLQQLELPRRYYDPHTATLASQLQVLAQVSDDPNCVYRLLQEQPTLCCKSSGWTNQPLSLDSTTASTATRASQKDHDHNDNGAFTPGNSSGGSTSSSITTCSDSRGATKSKRASRSIKRKTKSKGGCAFFGCKNGPTSICLATLVLLLLLEPLAVVGPPILPVISTTKVLLLAAATAAAPRTIQHDLYYLASPLPSAITTRNNSILRQDVLLQPQLLSNKGSKALGENKTLLLAAAAAASQ